MREEEGFIWDLDRSGGREMMGAIGWHRRKIECQRGRV